MKILLVFLATIIVDDDHSRSFPTFAQDIEMHDPYLSLRQLKYNYGLTKI